MGLNEIQTGKQYATKNNEGATTVRDEGPALTGSPAITALSEMSKHPIHA